MSEIEAQGILTCTLLTTFVIKNKKMINEK